MTATNAAKPQDGSRTVERAIDAWRYHVVDGLFAEPMVRMLHEIFSRLAFARIEFDNKEYLARQENAQLNCNLADEFFAANAVLARFRAAVIEQVDVLHPGHEWELDRIHCNSQSFGELQRCHTDLKGGLTALYFANAVWHDDWHGETLLYDASGEPVQAVGYRPGRLLMFPADIPHRGGLPSVICREARLSVAFKFRRPRSSQATPKT